jgi:predicted NUDIX family phosphoesterase
VDESVLVIPAARLGAVGAFTGWRSTDTAMTALLDPAHFAFRPRREVETDPAWKQLIPYCVLTYRGRVFHYTRGAGGGETRLNAKLSIGIGGHISEADARGGSDPYRTGMLRELGEEVELAPGWSDRVIGFLFDPSTPVGEVHLGIVHIVELADGTVMPRESGIAAPGFAAPEELLEQADRLETWSRLSLEYLTTKL